MLRLGVVITALGGRVEAHDISLEAMQALVGGYVEAVDVTVAGHECTIWLNEEGKLRGMPPNALATQLAGTRLLIGDYIAGDVIVTGGVGSEGQTLPVHDEAAAVLLGRDVQDG